MDIKWNIFKEYYCCTYFDVLWIFQVGESFCTECYLIGKRDKSE